ncbi:zf-HC2 domain-containing protein [Nodosilinea sp. LEGE 07298]|jgi:anti-sigma factor RsiW|uniref:anti-sigma factor family protein n=1 Tax=Nodosilinea sp. LEGE 07298 TaxID=2777970 RepID=UPI001882775C|nr:zf-HC2 domain-containing protein [Nodosilinea sp. LEGE 07298]MBE9111459.1 zf-HC2 domain-containing protein [Nodosilinea sp. LEGE 07298]
MASAASYCHDLDATKRDRFELLSAYLDGEVTPEERQQVLRWIQHDDGTRSLYHRLLALRQGMRSQTIAPDCGAEATLVGVFHCLNHRLKLVTMASAGVAAIGVINLLSGAGMGTPSWRMATVAQPEALEIALDKPAFPIPEASAVMSTDLASPLEAGGLPIDSEL